MAQPVPLGVKNPRWDESGMKCACVAQKASSPDWAWQRSTQITAPWTGAGSQNSMEMLLLGGTDV